MPSMTWLLESTSFSRGFLLRKMVGTGKQAGTALSQPLKSGHHSPPSTALSPQGKGGERQTADSSPLLPGSGLRIRVCELLLSLGLDIFTE